MTKIPVAQPKDLQVNKPSINTGSQATREIPVLPNVGDVISGIGKDISASAQMLQNALSLSEELKAKNITALKLADIQTRAATDTDLKNAPKYHAEIDNAVREGSSYISIPSARDNFMAEMTQSAGISKLKINSGFSERVIKQGKADFLLNRDDLKNQYISARSETERTNAILQDDRNIEKAVAAGFLDPVEVAKFKIDRGQDWVGASVDLDIQKDPSVSQKDSLVLQELLKGKEGIYGDLNEVEIAKKIKESKINIWRNKNNQVRLTQETNTQGALDLSKQLASNTLTLATIDDMARRKVIDIKTAAIFANAIDTKQKNLDNPEDTTANYLIGLVDKDKSTALDILNKAAELRGNNNLSDTAYAFVLQETTKKLEREKAGLSGWDQTTIKFINALKGLSSFSLSVSPNNWVKLAGDMVNRLIEKIQSGSEPNVAVKEIQRSKTLELHPQALTYPESGKKIMDASGSLKLITPEGDLNDTEEGNDL